MRLNFSEVVVEGFDVSSLVQDAGIYENYQVGVSGYCYGESASDLVGCKTPHTPFWFDLRSIFEQSKAGSLLDMVDIPQEVDTYESIVKKTSYAIWSLLIATCCLAFLTAVLGLFAATSRVLSVFVFLFALLMFLAAGVAAGAATALYVIYTRKFNDTVDQFGVSAHVGRVAMGLLWGMVAAALLAAGFWSFSLCCGSTRRGKNKDRDSDHTYTEQAKY